MGKPELETINKMYLELSQFATAKTQSEILLVKQVKFLQGFLQKVYNMKKTGWKHSNEVDSDIKFWMDANAELLKQLEEQAND